jgi:transposase
MTSDRHDAGWSEKQHHFERKSSNPQSRRGTPGPKPPQILLTPSERAQLEELSLDEDQAGVISRRARVILAAAAGLSNTDIARSVGMDVEAVGLWRRRWRYWQALQVADNDVVSRLADAPRPGKQPRLSEQQVSKILALLGREGTIDGRPLNAWSHRELAEKIVALGITDRISARHAARLLGGGRATVAFRPTSDFPRRGGSR